MCLEPMFLRILYISKLIINILRFVVPFALIFKTFYDVYRQILNPNEKEGMRRVINRAIAAVIIFLVPTIVGLIVSFISKVANVNINSGITQCMEFANIEYIKILEGDYAEEVQKNIESQKNKNLSLYEQRVEAVRKIVEDNKANSKNNDNSSESTSPQTNNTTNSTYTIFVGDSRTVGMCSNVKLSANEKCVAETSKALTWFQNTAINKVNNILNSNPNNVYNIVIDLGVNSLGNPSKYASVYNSLKENDWSKHNIVVTSVTPVNETKYEKKYHNKNLNSKIESFNNTLKTKLSSSIIFCDYYDKILKEINSGDKSITSSDGLHYKKNGYMEIYTEKKKCLK